MKTGAPNGTPPRHTHNIEKQNPTGAAITHFKHEKIPAGLPGNQPFFILGLILRGLYSLSLVSMMS